MLPILRTVGEISQRWVSGQRPHQFLGARQDKEGVLACIEIAWLLAVLLRAVRRPTSTRPSTSGNAPLRLPAFRHIGLGSRMAVHERAAGRGHPGAKEGQMRRTRGNKSQGSDWQDAEGDDGASVCVKLP